MLLKLFLLLLKGIISDAVFVYNQRLSVGYSLNKIIAAKLNRVILEQGALKCLRK